MDISDEENCSMLSKSQKRRLNFHRLSIMFSYIATIWFLGHPGSSKIRDTKHYWELMRDAHPLGQKDSPEPTSAEDPLIILYTSGTTGKPKGIAHTHASFPIKAAQDMAFGTDVGRGTRICWYTDIGWMMGAVADLRSSHQRRDDLHLRRSSRLSYPRSHVGILREA
jgi:acyl-CoA synthetase (AMP-forming)/AMP-acid ligase II